MINKRFYSFYLQGEQSQNSYQVWIGNDYIESDQESEANPDFDQLRKEMKLPKGFKGFDFPKSPLRDVLRLRDDVFIQSHVYDHRFLESLFNLNAIEVGPFLDYHLDQYSGNLKDFFRKIDLLFSNNNQQVLREEFDQIPSGVDFSLIEDHIHEVRKWIDTQFQDTPLKLKWNGRPAHFGFIFSELAEKGFIDAPRKPDGTINYSVFAEICFDLFDVTDSIANLKKELSKSSLTYANKVPIKIPNISELS